MLTDEPCRRLSPLPFRDRQALRYELAIASIRSRTGRSGTRPGVVAIAWIATLVLIGGAVTGVAAQIDEEDLGNFDALSTLLVVIVAVLAIGGISAVALRWAVTAAPPGLRSLAILPISQNMWESSIVLPLRLGAISFLMAGAPLGVRLIELGSGYGLSHAVITYILAAISGYVLAGLSGLIVDLTLKRLPQNLLGVARAALFLALLIGSAYAMSEAVRAGAEDPLLWTAPAIWPLVLRYALFATTESLLTAMAVSALGWALLRAATTRVRHRETHITVGREHHFDGRAPWWSQQMVRAARNPRVQETIIMGPSACIVAAAMIARASRSPIKIEMASMALIFGAATASTLGLFVRSLSSRWPQEHGLGLSVTKHLTLATATSLVLGLPSTTILIATTVAVGEPLLPIVLAYAALLIIALLIGFVIPPRLGDGVAEMTYISLHTLITGSAVSFGLGRLPPAGAVAAVIALGVVAAPLAHIAERKRRRPVESAASEPDLHQPERASP
ncbi:MAG: hypothetical protein GY926_19755 [bacterium]|nr:hypothetical protein [bacterium]